MKNTNKNYGLLILVGDNTNKGSTDSGELFLICNRLRRGEGKARRDLLDLDDDVYN